MTAPGINGSLGCVSSETEVDDFLDAVRQGKNSEVAAFLDKYGADLINAKDQFDQTGVMIAIRNGHAPTVALLLERGVSLEDKDDEGIPALITAISLTQKDIVQLLLDKGADIEATDSQGRTALMWAGMDGYAGIATLLLEKGAEIGKKDDQGLTALAWAEEFDRHAVIEILRQWSDMQKTRAWERAHAVFTARLAKLKQYSPKSVFKK